MKVSWPTKKLGEIINPQYGYTASAKDNGDYRLVRITDINNDGTLKNSDNKYISASLEEVRNYILRKGDLLVARIGSIGRMLYFDSDEPSVFASYLIRLNPDTSQVLPKYLWLFSHTLSYWRQVKLSAGGAVQPQFNANRIRVIKIPLPPLPIQHQIVSRLDAIKKAQELNDKQIELAEELFQSLLERELDPKGKNWEVRRLDSLIKLSSGKFISSKERKGDGIYPIYGGNGILGYTDRFLLDYSTVAIGRVGVYCGAVHFAPAKSWITDNAIYVKEISRNLNIELLYYVLLKSNLNRFANPSGQPKITQSPILNLKIPLPPLSAQHQIVAKLQRSRIIKRLSYSKNKT